ncbi:MAG: hypothetical protein AAGA65_31545 [Actinomycetota bacterium]
MTTIMRLEKFRSVRLAEDRPYEIEHELDRPESPDPAEAAWLAAIARAPEGDFEELSAEGWTFRTLGDLELSLPRGEAVELTGTLLGREITGGPYVVGAGKVAALRLQRSRFDAVALGDSYEWRLVCAITGCAQFEYWIAETRETDHAWTLSIREIHRLVLPTYNGVVDDAVGLLADYQAVEWPPPF